MPGSRLFQRNRTLGYVSNHVPANVRYIKSRNENVIVTSVGRLFHTYSCNHFRLICASGLHPENITCITADHYCVYTASGNNVYAWRASQILKHIYKGLQKTIHLLLPFGEHIIAIDEESHLKIWQKHTEDGYLELNFSNDEFKITTLMHPPTYLNKILLGSHQGGLQLWNIKKCKLVHRFRNFDSRITALEAAPAVDICAIGLHNGRIILMNLKYEEVIAEFLQNSGAVCGISFRTDGHAIMATSSTNGTVIFWNLDEKKVNSQLTVHDDAVATTIFLSNEPLLLTTSPDNSIKLWIFDLPDNGVRLLRIREGHSAPPLFIRYHGSSGYHILSASEDSSLRIFNTISESLNKSMGKASYNRKSSKNENRFEKDQLIMPPIVQFSNETTREKDWDNIAAVHSGLVMATTWSFNKCKMGNVKLVPEKFHNQRYTDLNTEATVLCLTYCGNFVIIGYSSGDVERYNIQSGIHRRKYGMPAHDTAVRGVYCDSLNQYIVTGGGSDELVLFWHFKKNTTKPMATINMDDSIILFRAHHETSILCVALESFSLHIVDCEIRRIVRKFDGHTAQITDVCFSSDGRWLISAAMDCTIKIWDIPSSYLIDHFRMENACISLSMSPTGNFLATAHVNYLGLFLWTNKSLFSQISLRSIDPSTEASYVDLSTLTKYNEIPDEMDQLNLAVAGEEIKCTYESPEQIAPRLITTSNKPLSHWQNLLELELLKKRNCPKEPLQKPKQTPFFLPTVAGLNVQFNVESIKSTDTQVSKVLFRQNVTNLTKFGKLLYISKTQQDYEKSIEHIVSLSQSMIHFEIKSLHPDGGGTIEIMWSFLRMIEVMFNSNVNFELAQTYLAVFLQAHHRTVRAEALLYAYLENIKIAQTLGWQTIQNQLLYCIGVIKNLRNY